MYKRLKFEALNVLSEFIGTFASWKYDRNAGCHSNVAVDQLNTFGYANLGNCGIDSSIIYEKLLEAFEQDCFDKRKLMSLNNSLKLKGMDEYISNPEIINTVQGYLGEHARFDRLWCYRIPSTMKERGLSSDWHHDRVGKRLKMFVLLHDVTEKDRPMQLISGSHLAASRRYSFRGSRMSVASRDFDITKLVKLTGSKGDVILFDTNLMHRADWSEGNSHRDVLSFEFADRRKGDLMQKFEMPIGPIFTLVSNNFAEVSSPLIDPRYISLVAGNVSYGRKKETTSNSYDL